MSPQKPRVRWTRNGTLAGLALVLGALAIFGDPHRRSGTVTINARELAAIVEGEVDHTTALELADWILEGRADYRLLDLRSAGDFRAYHIPTAESVTLTSLVDYPLWRNEKIVLYSGGGIHSAQAWFLLRAQGFAGASILLGGLEAWKDEVLFPSLPSNATVAELAEFARARFVSASFGGSPRTGGLASPSPPDLPKVEVPTSVPVATHRKKKSKEGC